MQTEMFDVDVPKVCRGFATATSCWAARAAAGAAGNLSATRAAAHFRGCLWAGVAALPSASAAGAGAGRRWREPSRARPDCAGAQGERAGAREPRREERLGKPRLSRTRRTGSMRDGRATHARSGTTRCAN